MKTTSVLSDLRTGEQATERTHQVGLNAVFLDGFDLGKTRRKDRFISARDAEKLRPQYSAIDLEVFLNGYEDGLSRDSWRAERIASSPQNSPLILWRLFT